MSLPNNLSAYEDCEDAFIKAIADPIGTRLLMPNYASAHMFQMRLHQYRSLLRAESQRVYEKGDPKWGKCEFDCLKVQKPIEAAEKDGTWWVYIRRHGQDVIATDALSEVEAE